MNIITAHKKLKKAGVKSTIKRDHLEIDGFEYDKEELEGLIPYWVNFISVQASGYSVGYEFEDKTGRSVEMFKLEAEEGFYDLRHEGYKPPTNW